MNKPLCISVGSSVPTCLSGKRGNPARTIASRSRPSSSSLWAPRLPTQGSSSGGPRPARPPSGSPAVGVRWPTSCDRRRTDAGVWRADHALVPGLRLVEARGFTLAEGAPRFDAVSGYPELAGAWEMSISSAAHTCVRYAFLNESMCLWISGAPEPLGNTPY